MCEAVVKREDNQGAVGAGNLNTGERLLHVGGVVAVGEDNTFGVGGSTGGVGDGCVVVVLDILTDFEEGLTILLQVLLAKCGQSIEGHLTLFEFDIVEHNNMFQCGQLLTNLANFGKLLLRHENQFNVSVLQTEEEVVTLFEFNREGYTDSTCIEQTELREYPMVTSLGEDRNGSLGLDTQRRQTATHFQDNLFNLLIGCRLKLSLGVGLLPHTNIVTILCNTAFKQINKGSFLHS